MRKIHVASILVPVFALLFATHVRAGDQGESCEERGACPRGQECVGNQCAACITECTIDCGPGTACQINGNGCAVCAPNSCDKDVECPQDETCIEHRCQGCLAQCEEIDCAPGVEYCKGNQNGCVGCYLLPGKCIANSDCPSGEVCVDNTCVAQ